MTRPINAIHRKEVTVVPLHYDNVVQATAGKEGDGQAMAINTFRQSRCPVQPPVDLAIFWYSLPTTSSKVKCLFLANLYEPLGVFRYFIEIHGDTCHGHIYEKNRINTSVVFI